MPQCVLKRAVPSATTRKIGKPKSRGRQIYGMAKKILTSEEKSRRRAENYNPIMAARQALRRAFSRAPIVIELMRENKRKVPRYNKDGSRHKIDASEYLCNVCGQWKRSVKNSKVVVDHIQPVVDPKVGFVDIKVYFERLWCDRSNLQCICGECHRQKTNAELFIRKFKEEQELMIKLEASRNKDEIKKGLKRFTKKKLSTLPYPDEFRRRLATLRNRLSKE